VDIDMETAVEVDKASRAEKSKKRKPNEQQKSTSSGRNFTSVQMFHTHTLDKNGSFE